MAADPTLRAKFEPVAQFLVRVDLQPLHACSDHRMQGIKMVKSGWHVSDVAEFFGVSRRVVFKWLEAYAEEGQIGLLAKTDCKFVS